MSGQDKHIQTLYMVKKLGAFQQIPLVFGMMHQLLNMDPTVWKPQCKPAAVTDSLRGNRHEYPDPTPTRWTYRFSKADFFARSTHPSQEQLNKHEDNLKIRHNTMDIAL